MKKMEMIEWLTSDYSFLEVDEILGKFSRENQLEIQYAIEDNDQIRLEIFRQIAREKAQNYLKRYFSLKEIKENYDKYLNNLSKFPETVSFC